MTKLGGTEEYAAVREALTALSKAAYARQHRGKTVLGQASIDFTEAISHGISHVPVALHKVASAAGALLGPTTPPEFHLLIANVYEAIAMTLRELGSPQNTADPN